MAKRTTTVEEHYSRGRAYPTIPRHADEGAENSIKREPSFNTQGALRNNRPQDPEDFHGPGYSNDASGWVRGAGEDATTKPGFDKGQSYRRADKGDDWHSGHDPAIIRKPGPNTPNR